MHMDISIIKRAYATIGAHVPMAFDCGNLCEKACCLPDEDGQGGVHLFPGEEALVAGCDWCHMENPDGSIAPILVCDGPCDRDARPLACRIFPLTPVFHAGRLALRMDARARAMCPLAMRGPRALNPEFCRAVLGALRGIAADPEGREFLGKWIALEEQYRGFRL